MSCPTSNMEIERKFLIAEMPSEISLCRCVHITQFYLHTANGENERRIRMMSEGAVDRFFITEKGSGGMIRTEIEREISSEEYSSLLPQVIPAPISKRRHYVPLDGGLTAEVDVYGGSLSGLVVVEVEFDSPETARAFAPPVWFGREITDDKRFKNRALALVGLPTD